MTKEKENELQKELETYLTEGTNELDENYKAVQILAELKKRYPGQLKGSVLSVRFYQTYEACYLEVTSINPTFNKHRISCELPEGDYSSMGIITDRESLAYLCEDITVAFSPDDDVILNACRYVTEWIDGNEPNLFVTPGNEDDDSCDDYYHKYYYDEIREPDSVNEDDFGERTYSGDELKSMSGYNSLSGPDRLDTGTLYWSLIDGFCIIEINEFLEYETNDPFNGVELKKGLVDIEISEAKDEKRYNLKISIEQISRIQISSELYEYSGEYTGPGTYTFRFDFNTGEALLINGKFKTYAEGFILKAGYYHHKIAYVSQE